MNADWHLEEVDDRRASTQKRAKSERQFTMMRRFSHDTRSQLNADWHLEEVDDMRASAQKRAKSEIRIFSDNSLVSFGKDANIEELLSSLRSTEFCGTMEGFKSDHTLKGKEWMRLPSGRNKGEKTRLRPIPTPLDMYNESMNSSTSSNITIRSGNSAEWAKKRSLDEMSDNLDALSGMKCLSLETNSHYSTQILDADEDPTARR